MQLLRGDKTYAVSVEREDVAVVLQKDGWKLLEDGSLVSLDATDAEVKHYLSTKKALEDAHDISVVFPGHYPANKELYYPGLEAFVWDGGNQVTVGGIENGPASRAGLRWGDRIIAVNGVASSGKSVVEVESLLTSSKPATIRLIIERAGIQKTFSFDLAQAASVLRDNQWQVINGKLIPLWVPDKYLSCFQ
jgi:C-terminal processing protease CtpA/Prc